MWLAPTPKEWTPGEWCFGPFEYSAEWNPSQFMHDKMMELGEEWHRLVDVISHIEHINIVKGLRG